MAPKAKTELLLLSSLLCTLLLSTTTTTCVAEDDMYCLKSIKQSLEDPEAQLSSWNFTINTTRGFVCTFSGVNCWNANENRVLGLHLRDMGLRGNFPRGIEYCRSLTSLDLSGNQFFGTLPSNLGQIGGYLTHLDLSNNSFSGEIPETIVNCVYLNVLLLKNNKLSGEIPEGIGRMGRLQKLDVSGNELVGTVPPKFGVESYANNRGLCGGPLEACNFKQKEKDHSFILMFIFGFGTGWVVFVLLFWSSWLIFQPPKIIVTKLANHLASAFSKKREMT